MQRERQFMWRAEVVAWKLVLGFPHDNAGGTSQKVLLPALADHASHPRCGKLEIPADASGRDEPFPKEDSEHCRFGFDGCKRYLHAELLNVAGACVIGSIVQRTNRRGVRLVVAELGKKNRLVAITSEGRQRVHPTCPPIPDRVFARVVFAGQREIRLDTDDVQGVPERDALEVIPNSRRTSEAHRFPRARFR